MEKTVVLKHTNKGLVIDTFLSNSDSLHIKGDFHTTVSVPNNTIKVILPEKTNLEVFSIYAIIIGGFAGLIGAIAAFWQLFKNLKDKGDQITQLMAQTGELSKQTQLNQARLRMIVKPRIWSNGGGWKNDRIFIDISNRGELGFYDGCKIIDGDNLEFSVPSRPIEIPKDDNLHISAPLIDKERQDIQFKIKIFYHDQENFKYETVFDWKGGATTFIETNEL